MNLWKRSSSDSNPWCGAKQTPKKHLCACAESAWDGLLLSLSSNNVKLFVRAASLDGGIVDMIGIRLIHCALAVGLCKHIYRRTMNNTINEIVQWSMIRCSCKKSKPPYTCNWRLKRTIVNPHLFRCQIPNLELDKIDNMRTMNL